MSLEQRIPVSPEVINNKVSKPRVHIRPDEVIVATIAGGLLGAGAVGIAHGISTAQLAEGLTGFGSLLCSLGLGGWEAKLVDDRVKKEKGEV